MSHLIIIFALLHQFIGSPIVFAQVPACECSANEIDEWGDINGDGTCYRRHCATMGEEAECVDEYGFAFLILDANEKPGPFSKPLNPDRGIWGMMEAYPCPRPLPPPDCIDD